MFDRTGFLNVLCWTRLRKLSRTSYTNDDSEKNLKIKCRISKHFHCRICANIFKWQDMYWSLFKCFDSLWFCLVPCYKLFIKLSQYELTFTNLLVFCKTGTFFTIVVLHHRPVYIYTFSFDFFILSCGIIG